MEAFFAQYPPFEYNSQQPPTSEFARLKATKPGWNEPQEPEYLRAHEAFRRTLNEQNSASGNAVAQFFSQFPQFEYDAKREDLDLDAEFKRLAVEKNWPKQGRTYRRNRMLFNTAVKAVEENTAQHTATPGTSTASVPGASPSSNIPPGASSSSNIPPGASSSSNIPPGPSTDAEASGTPSGSNTSPDPLQAYFSKFTDFDYNPSRSANFEFKRLTGLKKWRPGMKRYWRELQDLKRAKASAAAQASIITSIPGSAAAVASSPAAVTTTESAPAQTATNADSPSPAAAVTTSAPNIPTVNAEAPAPASNQASDDPPAPVAAPEDLIKSFFSRFPDFVYDPTVGTASEEFEKLAQLKGWDVEGEEYKQNHNLFLEAVKQQEELQKNASISQSPILVPLVIKPSYGEGPLDEFFRTFHDFTYEPSTPSEIEFQRLVEHRGWKKGKKRFKKARSGFFRATQAELHFHLDREDILLPTVTEEDEDDERDRAETPPAEISAFTEGGGVALPSNGDALGEMERDLKPWKRLCDVLDLRMPGGRLRPYSLEQCQEVLCDVFINIFEFINHLRLGKGTLKRFPSLKRLSVYSYDNRLVYPKDAAKQSEVLKFLLQPLRAGLGGGQGAGRGGGRSARRRRGAGRGRGAAAS